MSPEALNRAIYDRLLFFKKTFGGNVFILLLGINKKINLSFYKKIFVI